MSGGRYTQSGVQPVRCRCHLGCTRWDQIGATWQIRLNRPCAAAMQPYIKLLWPVLLLLYHSAWNRIWVFLQYFAKSVNITEVEEQRASLIALWWHVLRTVLVVVFSSEARHVRRTGSIDRGDHRVKDHRAPSGAIINKLSCSAFSQAWLQFTLFVQSVVLNFTRYDEVLRHDLWHPITLYISVFIQ